MCGRSLRQATQGTLVGEVRRQQYGSDADVEMGSARVRQRSLNALKLDHDNMGLHSLYVNDAIRGEFEAVQLRVFRNVFNNIYNITTRYVWIIIWSYTVQSFVNENTLKLRSTNSKKNYIKILHKIITPLLSLIITFKTTQDRCVWQVQRIWQQN